MATTRVKLDPGVLAADPNFESYYRGHVVMHEQRVREQLALPPDEQDPTWFMMVELDEPASVWWVLNHPADHSGAHWDTGPQGASGATGAAGSTGLDQ